MRTEYHTRMRLFHSADSITIATVDGDSVGTVYQASVLALRDTADDDATFAESCHAAREASHA